jgi:hypothetical protein
MLTERQPNSTRYNAAANKNLSVTSAQRYPLEIVQMPDLRQLYRTQAMPMCLKQFQSLQHVFVCNWWNDPSTQHNEEAMSVLNQF